MLPRMEASRAVMMVVVSFILMMSVVAVLVIYRTKSMRDRVKSML